MLKITLTKGLIGKRDDHRKVVKALGLGKFGSSVLREDCPTIRGMVNKIHHLVTVVEDGAKPAPGKKAAGKSPAKHGAEKGSKEAATKETATKETPAKKPAKKADAE